MAQLLDLPFDPLAMIVAYLPVDQVVRLHLACKRLKCVAERESRVVALKAAIVAANKAAATACSDVDFEDYSRLVIRSIFSREKRKRAPELEKTVPLRTAEALKKRIIAPPIEEPCESRAGDRKERYSMPPDTECTRTATFVCDDCEAELCDEHLAGFFCNECGRFYGCGNCNPYYDDLWPCTRCGKQICAQCTHFLSLPETGETPVADLCTTCQRLMGLTV